MFSCSKSTWWTSCCQQGFFIPTTRKTSAAMFEDFRPSKSIETSSSTWSSRSDTWVKSTHNSALPASSHHLFWGMILSFFFALNHERITWFPKSCGVSLTKLFSSFHYQQNDTTTLQFNVTNGRFFFETSLTANRWGLAAINKKSHCFAHPSCMEVVRKNSLAFNFKRS